MKNLLIFITILDIQSCCIGARDSGPVLLDAADKALNPYHVGDSFKMKDSKTGNTYWFMVKSRAMSAAQVHSGHKECETQLHTQKEETFIESDTPNFLFFDIKFTKGNVNISSEFLINHHAFNMENPIVIDSMAVAGQIYYQVHKGLNQIADRSIPPLIPELWTIFYTPKDGIIQGVYSDSTTLDLVK